MFGGDLNTIEQFFAIFVSFIIATTIHEFMHAWSAWKLGDSTAANLGRITFNPAMHFDPLGLFGMFMISVGIPFIGWGKPVPVNMNNLGRSITERKRGMAMIAFAGPLSNVVQAAVVGLPLRFAAEAGINLGQIEFYLSWFVWVNILLASFNMIPFPPLDGSRILLAIVPNFWYPILAPLERYGFAIILVLVLFGGVGSGILSSIISPVSTLLMDTISGGSLELRSTPFS